MIDSDNSKEEKLAFQRAYNSSRRQPNANKKAITIRGLIAKDYYSQVLSSIRRKHPDPAYSKKELIARYENDPLMLILFEKWVASGRDRGIRPSFDRIDNTKGYSFENIRLVTWRENHQKQVETLEMPVAIFKNGSLFGIYPSINDAGRASKIGASFVGRMVKHGMNSRDGYSAVYVKPAFINWCSKEFA